MATFSKQFLSGSTNGKQIKVAATATPGTAIHTPSTGTDEIWLYATNQDTVAVDLTVEYGGTTSPDDKITLSVPSKSGLTLVVPGLIISGSSYPVRAFASTGSVVMISGYVNRIT